MTLVSFMNKEMSHTSLEIDVDVNLDRLTFDLKPRHKSPNRQLAQINATVRDVPLEAQGAWNFLLLHFSK